MNEHYLEIDWQKNILADEKLRKSIHSLDPTVNAMQLTNASITMAE